MFCTLTLRRTALTALGILIASLQAAPLLAQQKEAEAEPLAAEAPAAPAPRSIEDIIKVLDQFKPDPARITAARAALALPTPQTDDRTALFRHYFQRGQAARRLGDDSAAIVDLRKARDYMPAGGQGPLALLYILSVAEFVGGNALNAVQLMQERLGLIGKNQPGFIIGHEAYAALIYSAFGDFNAARRSMQNAEDTFKRISRAPNAALYRHSWTSSVENARGEVFHAEGKLVEAEAAYRKAIRELDADIPDREERTRRGLVQGADETIEATRGLIYRRLAQVLNKLGRANEAEIHIRNALKSTLQRSGRFATNTALDMQTFAVILIEQGRFAEGTLMAREAVRSIEGSGAPLHSLSAIGASRALGAALVTSAKWEEALATFDAMRKNAESEPELARNLARGDLDWAHALLKMNQP